LATARIGEKVKGTEGKDSSGREKIGLASEYAQAAELCRLGFYAQLTLGHHKKTDLLVESKSSVMRFSVKAKTKYVWPKVSGIWQKGDRIVFVDFKDKPLGHMPDFYVLTVSEWVGLLKKIQTRHRSKGENCHLDPKTNTLVWPPWEGHPKGWSGCVVRVEEVAPFKDKWPKPGVRVRPCTRFRSPI
jgi:hypothetical protein